MNRDLFLYEVVDIVGQGQYEYMEHLWKDPVQDMPEMDKLQGSFYVCAFGGGRWPQVDQHLGRRAPTAGRRTPRTSTASTSSAARPSTPTGGTRPTSCAPAASTGSAAACPAAPAPPRSAKRGIKGTLFVNEIIDVRAGTALEYLAAVAEERVPMMRDYGHEPTGLYEVISNPHEVVMVWATSIPAHVPVPRQP